MTGRARWWSLAAVLSSTAGLGVAYGTGNTATSLRFAEWGTPGWLTGLAGAMPAVAVLLLVPLGPAVVGRLGAVRAIVAGALIMITAFALMPVLDAPGWWLVLRFLGGAGLALPWLVGETWINTVTPDRFRGRVLAGYTVLIFGGWAVGAQIVRLLGVLGPAGYGVGIAAMVLCVTPIVAGRRLAPPFPSSRAVNLRAAVAMAPLAMAAALVGGVAEFGYISLMPGYAIAAGLPGDQSVHVLTALVIGGVALQAVVGWLTDRVDRRRLLAALGLALAIAVAVLAPAVATFVPALAGAFVLGGVVTGFYSVGLAILGERVPASRLAAANAAFLMSYECGAVIGPVVGGAAIDAWHPHGLAVVMVAVGIGFAVAMTVRRRRRAAVPRQRDRDGVSRPLEPVT